MSDLAELWREIAAGAQGPKLAAFFVVHDALIAGTVAEAYEKAGGDDPAKVFATRLAGQIYPEMRELVRAHRGAGHTVVLIAEQTDERVRPLAQDLAVEHVLAEAPRGDALVTRVREFAAAHGVNLSESFAYAHDVEELPLLEAVGYPCVVNPKRPLRRISLAHGWAKLKLKSRGRPRAGQVVRTGAAFAGMGGAAAIGLGVGATRRDRRAGFNAAASRGADLVLRAAGVRLRVTGEENLAHRPAVIVFNHQSTLDMFVLAAVIRGDFTGVAKKELARDPSFAVFGYLADAAYIDRTDVVQAKEALAPAIDRLKAGVSIIVAPEGTRSATPTPGPFKKGALHLAMQAGVPIIPIVIRNAGDVIWSKSLLVRPGQVDVAVLPPVSTEGWEPSDLEHHVAAVRQMFIDALEHWGSS